eukprot:CAMPEP_0201717876 /NCGR_PEP_ID=MMETSP0593-20130828/3538_1 /ASSEMBLY_ACC=CAM_ASM_000672 /TAXON_ID=267983 /ORGANISM="Skeletonema japonicum, Strain CCMP2506" /LENGTH=622 /DNA_ID=CAMNT_0048208051 /DNA_START=46 /DNA_END=1914 /DNA_ORIENTATION=-
MMEPSKGDDTNPLAFIDAAGSSDNGTAALTDDTDLLGGSGDNIMEVYDLNKNDSDANEEVEIEEELSDDDSADGDLLDMAGWNLRRHRNDEAQIASNTGEDFQTKEVEAAVMNSPGGNNMKNSRRGLFGGWGKGKSSNNISNGSSGNLSAGHASGPPSWSNTDGTSEYSQVAHDGIDEAALAYGEGGITGDDDLSDEIIDAQLVEEQKMDNELRPGDHIFIWQAYGINPRAYQRHAVVYSVTRKGQAQQELGDEQLSFDLDNVYNDYEDDVEVTVVSFYHFQRHHSAHGASRAAAAASGNSRGKRRGCKRELLHDFIGPNCMSKKKPVRKVKYGRTVKKGLLSQKAGVGTALKKDQPGLILARVQYLLDNQDHLPSHNALSANGECAAMWCVTGRWCTLQGASILAVTGVGQAGGALLAGGILSNLTVLVPMPGLWGMAGWWWYVPATVAYPFLVPTLVGLGMCSLVPLEILRRNRKKWKIITDGLNHEFWLNTSDEVKEMHFGTMAEAEREAELKTFFGVKEGDKSADDARYMPVGGAPGGIDDSDDEDEALAMQEMEKNCQNMAADINVDLSGKPPPRENGKGKGWTSFMGFSNKKNESSEFQDTGNMKHETERMHSSFT